MKPGLVTKIDTRNKTTSKKFDENVMSGNCDITVILPIYGQFGAIRSSHTIHTKKSQTQLSHYCFG